MSRFEHAELTGVRIEMLERYVAGMGGRLRLLAEMPDGTIAEIPLQNGKLVKFEDERRGRQQRESQP